MLEGPPEVLLREYRGYRYVAEDLFADDAEWLAEEGWHVRTTEWEIEHGNVPEELSWAYALFLGGWLTPPRQEHVLRVTYHRGPDRDGPDAAVGAQ